MDDNFSADALDVSEVGINGIDVNEPVATSISGGSAGDDSEIVRDLLAYGGIPDADRMKFADDNGNVREMSWDSLGTDEKYNIIDSVIADKGSIQMSNQEVELINHIRNEGLTPNEYLNAIVDQSREEGRATPNLSDDYAVDEFSDDELFMLDTMSKYGDEDVSDEQLDYLLNNAKRDPEMYRQMMGKLRSEYRQRENENLYARQQAEEEAERIDYENFRNDILNTIDSMRTFGGREIVMSTQDKNDLANFILAQDENGETEFGKALEDPMLMTKAAFWLLKGPKVVDEFSGQLRQAYNDGARSRSVGRSQLSFGTPARNSARRGYIRSADTLDVK